MVDENHDNILIKQLIKGDAFAFDEIYKKYNQKVYAFSFSNLKNREDAEGVVQEVFLNLWKDRARLNKLRNMEAWIFTISFNIIRKRFRKLARERIHLANFSETSLSDDTATIAEIEYKDLLEKADKIIDKLPPRQKTIFLLSKKQGLSNTEISGKLNITNKTVENHLTRARAFLKKSFVDESLLTILFFGLFLK
jgi:RNA polymerase sigma-70 factor (ECF subfamily)